jgi:hypothetical protein
VEGEKGNSTLNGSENEPTPQKVYKGPFMAKICFTLHVLSFSGPGYLFVVKNALLRPYLFATSDN